MAPVLVGCQALPCADAAGCCSLGPGHKAVGCRIVGGPRANAGLLVGGVRAPKTSELLPTHWHVRQGPGVIAKLLAGTAISCSLAAGPRNPRTHFRHFGGWGWFLTHLDMVSCCPEMSSPASGQKQGPASLRVESDSLRAG